MIDPLQQKAIEWAKRRDDIRFVVLIGSRARPDHPADTLSDLDLVLFTTDVQAYHAKPDWLGEIGSGYVSIPNPRTDTYPEYLVLFKDDQKLDFNFFPMSMLAGYMQGEPTPNAFHRGYVVLLDKDGLAEQLSVSPFMPLQQKPTRETFEMTINTFWFDARVAAKSIYRGELWVAKNRDRALKDHLLQVIEWHEQAAHDWNYDTWYRGRFIAEWASPTVYEALQATFGHFNGADSWRALIATMDLFRQLATEIATKLGYTYPNELDEAVTTYIDRLKPDDRDLGDTNLS